MAEYQHIEHGFDPVFDESSRILILGSFPSVQSRQKGFYYENPRNRFWRVVAACAGGEEVPPTAEGKRRLLLSRGIALWDVIESCDIVGSSDASIRNVVPVDISRVLGSAAIEAVFVNGRAAEKLYRRYLESEAKMPAVCLPSTSPANAAWSIDRLIERWGEELAPYLH